MNQQPRLELLQSLEESVRILSRILRKAALEKGLTGPQFGFLRLLQESRSARISELAAATGVGASSISGIVTRLEKLGLIHRKRSSEDRRVVDVYITSKGEELVSEVMVARLLVLDEYFCHLDEEKLQQVAVFLKGRNPERSQ